MIEEDIESIKKSVNDLTDKVNEIIEKLNPIVKIDPELRADIKKALGHGKNPRRQPSGDAWKKRCCNNCAVPLLDNEHFKDAEGNEYCKLCKDKVEAIAGDNA